MIMSGTSEVGHMTTNQLERPTKSAPPPDRRLGRAWIAVASIPVFFFVSFAFSYFLYDLFGYKPENNDAPLWVDVVVAVVGLVIFLVPCVAAVVYGRQVVRGGDRRGLVPIFLAVGAGGALAVLTIVTTVADAVR
jgi:hypothetical protein